MSSSAAGGKQRGKRSSGSGGGGGGVAQRAEPVAPKNNNGNGKGGGGAAAVKAVADAAGGGGGEDSGEPCCVVCFKPVEIYSVGECDHPVCFECSTRMRVLCLQNECPICRHQLHKVIFTPECLPFRELTTQSFTNNFFERRYRIGFVNEDIKRAYFGLLEHNCKECGAEAGPFRNFEALKSHMLKSHDLFFCDLCVDNLKIFTFERKHYTKPRLQLHQRKGDPDDSSHKGHPLCEFCRSRYMDTDELYRHLRKHHLYCHLCDADGFDYYYGSYSALRDHFKKEHYLCEEGECSEDNLTAVFRSDIDLIAHKALEHGKGLRGQAARQARTLELQFTYTRPPRPGQRPGPTPAIIRSERDEEETVREPVVVREEPARPVAVAAIDTGSAEQFPSLGLSSGSVVAVSRPPPPMVMRQTASALVKTNQNFPALGGESSSSSTPTLRVNIHTGPSVAGPSNAILKSTVKPNVSIQVHNRPTTANNFKLEPTKQHTVKSVDPRLYEDLKNFEEEFPTLGKKDKNLLMNSYCGSTSSVPLNSIVKKTPAPAAIVQPTVSIPVNLTPKAPPPPSSSAFPALCSTTAAPKQPQWIVAAKPKEQSKKTKVAPAPIIPTMTDINNAVDFPTLSTKSKGKKGSKNELNNNRNIEDENNQETGKKDKKKNGFENQKNRIPPDNAPKVVSESDTNRLKNGPEPTWVAWKGKKGSASNQNEKPTYTPVKKEPAVKINDFPALNSNKNVAGFKNLKKDSNENNSNASGALNYSAKLKDTEKVNGKCEQSESASSSNSVFLNSIPPCNGFTFTNSSGEDYDIPVYNYLHSDDFHERNKALSINLMTALPSQESIEDFKQFSRQFREGVYTAEAYYEHCKEAIGSEFSSLFPEMLALLPDISKQRELFEVYVNKERNTNMVVCLTCGQILLPDDYASHINSHNLNENFPSLGDAVQTGSFRRK